MKESVTVRARPNLALVKYWGKQDGGINIPATPSLGITLEGIHTTTTLKFDKSRSEGPRISIGGALQDQPRFLPFFNTLEQLALRKNIYTKEEFKQILSSVHITSENNFPTAAGLASSSSGFGALAYGIDALLEMGLSQRELSALARTGSGSAARTLFGGFVEFKEGSEFAGQLHPADFWPELRIILLTVSAEKKKTSSREGMTSTRATSPYYSSWLSDSRTLFSRCAEAVANRDIEKTGTIARLSYMRMFATMLASDPPLVYWHPKSIEILHTLEDLRQKGVGVWETMDAGPQVKLICLEKDCGTILKTFNGLALEPVVLKTGNGPEVVDL